MRTALVHDYLNQRGGAERVFSHIARAYPEGPIFTALLEPGTVGDLFDLSRIQTSFLQNIPGSRTTFRFLAPLYPAAFEKFDLRAYDLVVSSTTAWAKGVHTRPDAIHVCYINTVSRFALDYEGYVGGLLGLTGKALCRKLFVEATRPVINQLIAWDHAAAQRPTAFIANSKNVAQRVKAYYGRDAYILPCPVDVHAFTVGHGGGGYALVVSRLLPYKRIDLAIMACAKANVPLKIIGTGPAEAALRECAKGTQTEFLGSVDDTSRASYMADAQCVILPGEEDFGLVPVEAASAGRPVIAFGAGGALETIIEGETGVFFLEPTADSLAQALRDFRALSFHPLRLRAHAETFAPACFIERLHALIDQICIEHGRARWTAPTFSNIPLAIS